MNVQRNVATALLAAVLCVLAPLAVPMGPVPITAATLGVYVAVGLLGTRRGCASVGIYLLLGALGVPIFAGFSGGLWHLVGPTGGYLLGYVACVLVAGVLMACWPRRGLIPLWLICGTVVLYAVGTAWYVWQTDVTVTAALLTCVVPFLPADGIKIAVATGVLLSVRKRMPRLCNELCIKEEESP